MHEATQKPAEVCQKNNPGSSEIRLIGIVVSGELGSGKTTTARFLAETYGLEHLSFVEKIWVPILRSRNLPIVRANLQQLGIELMTNLGPKRLTEQLLTYRTTERIIIDDVRCPAVLNAICKHVPRLIHIHLTADFETRFPRLVKRDGITSESEQRSAEAIETETTIADLKPLADIVLPNTGSLSDLFASITSFIEASNLLSV